MGKGDCFGFLRKIFVLPKMGKMCNFLPQNQHFKLFIDLFIVFFSDIVPDDRYSLKVTVSDY